MKNSIKPIIFIISAFMLFDDVSANRAIDVGLEMKSKDSDVVLIGSVREVNCPDTISEATKNYVQSCALVIPSILLKGVERLNYVVRCDSGVAELAHDSCKTDGIYLLFLKNAGDETFYVTNGKFGTYRIN